MRCFFQRASRDKRVRGSINRKDLKDPHAAAMWDFVAVFCREELDDPQAAYSSFDLFLPKGLGFGRYRHLEDVINSLNLLPQAY